MSENPIGQKYKDDETAKIIADLMDCDDWCDRRHTVERTAKIKTSF